MKEKHNSWLFQARIILMMILFVLLSCSNTSEHLTHSLLRMFYEYEQEKNFINNQDNTVLVAFYDQFNENEEHNDVLRLKFLPKPQSIQSDSILFVGCDNVFFCGGYPPDNDVLSMLSVDDSPEWKIVLTDNKLNPFLTRKYQPKESIDDIVSLFINEGFDIVSKEWTDSRVFSGFDVEQRADPDAIFIDVRDVIPSSVLNTLSFFSWKTVFCCSYVVSATGQAKFSSVEKNLMPREMEKKLLSYSDSLCSRTVFKPAVHRGVLVNSEIVFFCFFNP